MAGKSARLIDVRDEVAVDKQTAPDFLLEYEKAVLLALKERGVINDMQCQMCIDRLADSFRNEGSANIKSAHL